MEKWTRVKFQPNLPLGENGERLTGSLGHIGLSKEAAKEGMVLLKNRGDILPLKKGTRVALFGKAAFDYVKGGGGSGDVTVAYIRNLYEGLKMQKDVVSIFEPLCDYYRKDVERQYAQGSVPGMTIEPEVPQELLNEAKAYELFGRRTGLLKYMKFSTLLVQNLKKGSDGLLRILEYEAADVLKERRENARILGEQAGTKLLMPMVIMMAEVFAIIIYAAFQNM